MDRSKFTLVFIALLFPLALFAQPQVEWVWEYSEADSFEVTGMDVQPDGRVLLKATRGGVEHKVIWLNSDGEVQSTHEIDFDQYMSSSFARLDDLPGYASSSHDAVLIFDDSLNLMTEYMPDDTGHWFEGCRFIGCVGNDIWAAYYFGWDSNHNNEPHISHHGRILSIDQTGNISFRRNLPGYDDEPIELRDVIVQGQVEVIVGNYNLPSAYYHVYVDGLPFSIRHFTVCYNYQDCDAYPYNGATVALSPDRTLYFTGGYQLWEVPDLTSQIIRLWSISSDGDSLWSRDIFNSDLETCNVFGSVAIENEGVAIFYNTGFDRTSAFYVALVDSHGSIVWNEPVDDIESMRYSNVQSDSTGAVYVYAWWIAEDDSYIPKIIKLASLNLDVPPQQIPLPSQYQLHPNFPNPFNPSTEISFDMPYGAPATLKVYDVLGREVATLADGMLEAGTHRVTFDGTGLASGVYIYRLESNNFVQSKKMVLMK